MDYYQILGVSKTATPEEIKRAYRKLASSTHPDKGGDTSTFQKIEEAYRILSNPETKSQYDNPQPKFGGFDGAFTGNFDPNEIFSHIFSQRAGNPFAQFGQRSTRQLFRTQLLLSLEDVYNGSTHVVKLQTPMGQKIVNIDVPKGLQDGAHLRYDNLLDNNTSLLIEFKIQPHLKFDRKGDNLYCNQKISVLDLITGTRINFETISGKIFEVTIPPKTQPHLQLKIAGQGMPIPNTPYYGDQILLLKPYIPDIIPDEITQSILRHKT